MSNDVLHVVTALSNPLRYRSRYQLFEKYVTEMLKQGASLTIVEVVQDERITMSDKILDRIAEGLIETAYPGVNYIPLRTGSMMWHKEMMWGIGADNLPDGWKYALFSDADITFHNPNWMQDTIAALQIYDVVQPWSHAVDLDPQHQMVNVDRNQTSFMYSWRHGANTTNGRYDSLQFHPGYAVAMTRRAYEALGGFVDTAILGAGDRHLMMALVGKAELSIPKGVTQGYKNPILAIQDRADAYIQHNVSYVPGLITHGYHGSKASRGYNDRWSILVRNSFDPSTDLVLNRNTRLYEWGPMTSQRMRNLRDEVRQYFASRSEDTVV